MNYVVRLALATIALATCASAAKQRAYLTPSEALAQASSLDGKKVTIGGIVDLGTNSRCLYDSVQAIRERNGDGAKVVTLSEGDRLLLRRPELNHRFVLVTGIFKRVFNEPGLIDLYQCNEAGIEQESVRKARR